MGHSVTQIRETSGITVPVVTAAGAIFLLAAAGSGFHFGLTRIFALLLPNQTAFTAVLLVVLGLGFGAAAGYAGLRWWNIRAGSRPLTAGTLALAVVFPVTAWLLTRINSADLTAFTLLVALLPFASIGWVSALAYTRFSLESEIIFSAGLFGAAFGLMIALVLFPLLGPIGIAVAVGTLAALAALLLAWNTPVRPMAAGVLVVLIVLTLVNRASSVLNYDPASVESAPPDKTLVRLLRANPNAEIVATGWSPFGQIDVVATDDPAMRYVFTDAGSGSVMLRYNPDDPDENDYGWIEREVASLPIMLEPNNRVLLLDAGAGYDIVLADILGADSITAVESNPALVAIIEQMADFNGGILSRPNANTVVTDARNFAERAAQAASSYDLVYMNLISSQPATVGSFGLGDTPALTVEALRAYWKLLGENGRMAFVLQNGLEGARLLVTALQALEDEGMLLSSALTHAALVKTASPDASNRMPAVLVVKRQPWEPNEAEAFSLDAARRGMQPLYIPYRAPEALEVLVDGTMTLDHYIEANTAYNLFPATDNQPFFDRLDPGLPPALRTLLVLSGLSASAYLIVTAALQPKNARHEWTRITLAAYCGVLGIGLMLVEIVAVQRFSLLFGDPALLLATTLGVLLLGAGLGSLFSRRFTTRHAPAWAALTLGTAVGVSIFVYPEIVRLALSADLTVRLVMAMAVLLPVGFVLGIPFPIGLRAAGEADPIGVPLYWGMTAVSATFGTALVTALAMLISYQAVLIVGGVVSLAVILLLRMVWTRAVS